MGEGLAHGEGDVRAARRVHLSDHAYTHRDDAEPWAGNRTAYGVECPPPSPLLQGRPRARAACLRRAALSAGPARPIRLGESTQRHSVLSGISRRFASSMERWSGRQASEKVVRGLRERRLFARARDEKDAGAMDELFRLMLPLAERLARRSQWSREPLEDLLQVASLSLYRALQRFDPNRSASPSATRFDRRRPCAPLPIASDYRLFAHPCCRTSPRSALLGAQKLGPNHDLGSASP